jgi:signal transduction histidine kinase
VVAAAYAMAVASEMPTLASLDAARERQRDALRWLRPLGAVIVVIVLVTGARAHPHPAVHGRGLAIGIALAVFAVAWVGAMRSRRSPVSIQMPLFLALTLSSAALVWLQPSGPGILGVFVAVGVAAMRGRGPVGAVGAVVGLVSVVAAGIAVTNRSGLSIVLSALGVTAFYLVSLQARRLREGQDQAERMLAELERTREAQAEAAALEERQRLAREVHDVLAHSLSGLVLHLEGARLLASRPDGHVEPELAEAVERAHHLAKAGLEEARQAIGMLRGDELPGPERLEALAREFERDSAVPCRLEVAGTERELGTDARLTVYRVAQEALTNVRKHADARLVEVRLGYEPAGTRLSIEDHARNGARPGPPAAGGYGLTGMRERARLLGGTLEAGATPSGFRVELWVPA